MGKNMEFQDAVSFVVHRSIQKNRVSHKATEAEKFNDTATPGRKWKIFYRASSAVPSKQSKPGKKQPPEEFLCPISGSLMADPVIVSSGHTFERVSVQACKNLNFTPRLSDGSTPDFSTVIPNLALKSAIAKWCQNSANLLPEPPDVASSEKFVHRLMTKTEKTDSSVPNKIESQKVLITEEELIQGMKENPPVNFNHAATEVTRRPAQPYWNSEESAGSSPASPPMQLSTRPSCYSSSSSSEIEVIIPSSPEEENIFAKLKSSLVSEIEEAVISLRKLTKTREDTRVHLCSPRLLSVLRSLIVSKYTNIQVNAVAALVNLSLEKVNKVKILRSGIVPPLIDVLKGGSPEVQEHASGALFSLAIHDDNKTAIGVLGALPPLLNLLQSDNERTRNDSALTLYHLSLVQSNRTKMIKLGSVPILMNMLKSGTMRGYVLLILGHLASCGDGRAAMLDARAVECLVGLLSGSDLGYGSTRESCVAALYELSHGGLRFKAVARAAGVVEALKKEEKVGSERAREKVKRILEMMRVKEESDEDDVDWEGLLDSGLSSLSRVCVSSESTVNVPGL
ncbi:U-box domain-containing protein 40 [Neltuma alba]|uniref:U-box domain-containing protein 40 n=1 Tax=Neltuma alba TaxID=207710 RepID=UPI0010A3D4A7|nr:U-box domain-containing protein 40 [Prosopis alba]